MAHPLLNVMTVNTSNGTILVMNEEQYCVFYGVSTDDTITHNNPLDVHKNEDVCVTFNLKMQDADGQTIGGNVRLEKRGDDSYKTSMIPVWGSNEAWAALPEILSEINADAEYQLQTIVDALAAWMEQCKSVDLQKV